MLRPLFHAYRWRILGTYCLFGLENVLRLLQPLALGLAINDLLRSSPRGLLWLVGQHLAHLLLGMLRQVYDTRAFTGIYSDLASGVVVRQRRKAAPVSQVAARAALSREFVDFFERQLPAAMRALCSIVGALGLLLLYDKMLAGYCLLLMAPALLLNSVYGRRVFHYSRELHDEFEREVGVIERCEPQQVRRHFDSLAHWWVKLSDSQAVNFGLMELFVLGLLAASLVRICSAGLVQPGDILAIFRYVLLFVGGLDSLPMLAGQFNRLRDLNRRFQADDVGQVNLANQTP